jgi:ABC-type multidrug transport system fused ATPase/permease subunit
MTELIATYQKRTATFSTQAAELKKRYNQYAIIRLTLFVAAVGITIFLFSYHWGAGILFFMAFLPAFYRFMLWHQQIQQQEKHNTRLADINTAETEALQGNLSAYPHHDILLEDQHPYAADLDIFGPFSLFQYMSRCNTAIGRVKLAGYLSKVAAVDTIHQRQQAIQEISPLLDWRQHLQAFGAGTVDDINHSRLLEKWLALPSFVQNNKWLKLAMYVMPFWNMLALALYFMGLHWFLAILFLLLPGQILRRTLDRVNAAHQLTAKAEASLTLYAKLIQHIEETTFQSPLLSDLQSRFVQNNQPASKSIQRLSYIISQLNVRYNPFAILLNLFALWDLHWVYRLEKWQDQHRDHLLQWFEALAEFEALNSIANTSYNNPDWHFPTITATPAIEAVELGHPLLHRDKRVTNDLTMPTSGHIKLLTGSNMAGKSTLLRTVGLNIVLAMVGSPVCARSLQLPPLQVYTSMRTQDALQESTSSFYAELKRLKYIIEAVERGDNIFFLLDEILKGTNSNDRHTGSKALIKQLIHSKGGGIIATHDLELGALEAQYDGAIENLCLEVEIKDGKLFFDYKLKKGVSQSFNATLLMQQMGIRISDLEQEV